MIDWNKPIQTKSGLKARLLCDDLDVVVYKFAVAVRELVGSNEFVITCDYRGRREHVSDDYHIINIPD